MQDVFQKDCAKLVSVTLFEYSFTLIVINIAETLKFPTQSLEPKFGATRWLTDKIIMSRRPCSKDLDPMVITVKYGLPVTNHQCAMLTPR